MSKIILPKRLQKRFPPKQEEQEPQQKSLEKMPEPTGWRILILPYKGKAKTEGGVLLPDQAVEREALGTVCGYVL